MSFQSSLWSDFCRQIRFGVILLGIIFLCASVNAEALAPSQDASFSVWQLPAQGATQMMSYVVRTRTGKLIVIDGGRSSDAEYLKRFIVERGGSVDAWFITHVHDDHCEALTYLLRNFADLKVHAFYASLPEPTWFKQACSPSEMLTYQSLMAAMVKSNRTFVMPRAGAVFNIDDVVIQVLGVCNPEITTNPINNSSMVLRMHDAHKSVLFLGDLGKEGGRKLLAGPYGDMLPSDYVQMAHHGQNGVEEDVYRKISPRYCLWPTPKWLWDNNAGAGEDSGHYQTKEVRGWMQSLAIEKHYLMFDGIQEIQ